MINHGVVGGMAMYVQAVSDAPLEVSHFKILELAPGAIVLSLLIVWRPGETRPPLRLALTFSTVTRRVHVLPVVRQVIPKYHGEAIALPFHKLSGGRPASRTLTDSLNLVRANTCGFSVGGVISLNG